MSIQRFKIGPRMSQAVVHNDTVYLAGQVAEDTTADAKGQTSQILNQIDELLALIGTDKSKLLSATVYLSDMAHFGAMNAAWEAWVDPANPPVARDRGSQAGRSEVSGGDRHHRGEVSSGSAGYSGGWSGIAPHPFDRKDVEMDGAVRWGRWTCRY